MEKVSHAVAAYGYIVEDRDGASVAYTGDTGPTVASGRGWRVATSRR
jgi:ribonuclease BN (tRNA processing enzyme)